MPYKSFFPATGEIIINGSERDLAGPDDAGNTVVEDHSGQSLQHQSPVPDDVKLKTQPTKVALGTSQPLDSKES